MRVFVPGAAWDWSPPFALIWIVQWPELWLGEKRERGLATLTRRFKRKPEVIEPEVLPAVQAQLYANGPRLRAPFSRHNRGLAELKL